MDGFVSLGNVVEVPHDGDSESSANDGWDDENLNCQGFTIIVPRKLFKLFLLPCAIFRGEFVRFAIVLKVPANTKQKKDSENDRDSGVDEKLDSHPLDEFTSVVGIVLLEPHEPFVCDEQWQKGLGEIGNGLNWHGSNHHTTANDRENGANDRQNGHDLHTRLDLNAEAACLLFISIFEIFARHICFKKYL